MKKLLFCLFFLLGLSFLFIRVNAASAEGTLVFTNPGVDSSTQMNIAWHSSVEGSYVLYTEKTDSNFTNATKVMGECYADNETFSGKSYYKCGVELDGLEPDTKYQYKVGKTTFSDIHEFKTAGNDGSFSFIWGSDSHAYGSSRMKIADTLFDYALGRDSDIEFILFSGDETAYGGAYDEWVQWSDTGYTDVIHHYMYADVPGNHTYYDNGGNTLVSDKWFQATQNNPENGPQGINSSYWFLYNNVLFINIDSPIIQKNSGNLNPTMAWFEKVVKDNAFKYQYLIVQQHYTWYNALTGGDGPYISNNLKWRSLFDQYGVDLALSGDHHAYLRTKPLYNGKISSDPLKGTVYMTSPQIGDRARQITDNYNENLMAKRLSGSDFAQTSGLSIIKVSPEEIHLTLIDNANTVKDEVTIPAKREMYDMDDFDKTAFKDSLQIQVNEITYADAALNFIEAYPYVQKIEVKTNTGTTLKTEGLMEGQTSFSIPNLTTNTIVPLTITVTYMDGSSGIYYLSADMRGPYGEISGLAAEANPTGVKFHWQSNLINDRITYFYVYVNDVSIDILASNATEIQIPDANLQKNQDNLLQLIAYDSYDEEVVTLDLHYTYVPFSFEVTPETVTLKEGETQEITINTSLSETPVITSSDEGIAKIEGTSMVAISEGTATITVKIGDYEETITVTVESKGCLGNILNPVLGFGLIAIFFRRKTFFELQ